MSDRFLKLAEVQEMLAVSRSTLWRWTAENGLKVVRVGAVTRIRESDLQAFLRQHEAQPQYIASDPPSGTFQKESS